MMNLYVLGTCLFQRIQLINRVTGDPIPGSERGYGFLSRETDYGVAPDYRQCTWYPQEEYDLIFDGWMHTGRIFAFISAILAAVSFVVIVLTCCVAFSPIMFERWLFWFYIVAAITIALSFFIYGSEYCSENACKVADGSGWAISAFMFHLVSANTVKSFAQAGPKQSSALVDEEEDLDDEELDDLYYEHEDDKYPPHRPEGPRGVILGPNGEHEYDDGENYYDSLGRMIDPYGERRTQYQDHPDNDEGLDDISDHDLEAYASDDEGPAYDEDGNPIWDPDAEHGNMGVGYENEEEVPQPPAVDEFGNPIEDVNQLVLAEEQQQQQQPVDHFDDEGQLMAYDNQGETPPDGQLVAYEEKEAAQVDEFGNPILPIQDGGATFA